MKIKNLKLMLLGLLAMMGVSNAFAAATLDESGRSVNGINYECWSDGDNHYAIVVGVNNKATTAEQTTISIPATVTGEKFTYKVKEFKNGWESAILDVSNVTTSLSIDVTNFATLKEADAFNAFKKLASLTITDTNAKSAIKKIDCSSMNAGTKGTLKSYNFSGSKINELAADCFKGFTALEAVNLTGIETIGANAFDGCNNAKMKTLTVPNTVKSIGASAFANMTTLETVTINANDAITAIPATCFDKDGNIKTLTISGNELTTIAAGVFTTKKLEVLDLSGCKKLATITGAFDAANKYKKVLLAGTAITDITTDPSLAASAGTLEEITFPANITTIPSFKSFIKITKIDLSGTKVKAIPASAFKLCSALTEVKLNAETASIGAEAFEYDEKLTTIENLNNAAMATIGNFAFHDAGLTSVDLSATALTTIGNALFKDCSDLTSVKLSDKITAIGDEAFSHCVKLASLNLENTKITVLNNIFSTGADDESAPCDALKSLKLPETLKTVVSYALQMTGIEEITIPSSVNSWGWFVLQGCLNLKKFVWNDIDPAVSFIGFNTFRGDDKLEEVYFITSNAWSNISDNDFEGNDPERLKVYVNAETYASLVANGWTPANTKYATLVGEAEKEFAFNEKGKSAVDGFYYATYYNDQCATWFPEEDFEVFTAVLDGSNIKLNKADVENGYYKVARWDGTKTTSTTLAPNTKIGNQSISVCIVRSKSQKAKVEYKYAGFNNISTLPTDNALQITDGSIAPSRLKFQYKLGAKDGQVKFWRVTSGNLKDGVVFIESTNPKAPEFMDIVFDGEATAIDAIQTVNEENGAIYNLQGVQVKNAKKGLYIQNGQKFIVK